MERRPIHGVGGYSEQQLSVIKAILPSREYENAVGLKERWEIKEIGNEKYLLIPQPVLADIGKPFQVTGSFTCP